MPTIRRTSSLFLHHLRRSLIDSPSMASASIRRAGEGSSSESSSRNAPLTRMRAPSFSVTGRSLISRLPDFGHGNTGLLQVAEELLVPAPVVQRLAKFAGNALEH